MNIRKNSILVWLCFLPMGLPAGLNAEEPPHFRFTQGLRGRGYLDLADEYLSNLERRNPPLPDDLFVLIPVEQAKTQALRAVQSDNSEDRTLFISAARTGFESFLRSHPNHTNASETRAALASLLADEAEHLLFLAEYQTQGAAQRTALRLQSRKLCRAAALHFEQVIQLTRSDRSAQRSEADTPDSRLLNYVYRYARNLSTEALTFGAAHDEIVQRGHVLNKALEVLEPFFNKYPRNPVSWQIAALRGRCYQEQDKRTRAREEYDRILNQRATYAAQGQRLVRYFQILESLRTGLVDGPDGAISQSESWLRDYGTSEIGRETHHIGYLWAAALVQRLQKDPSPLASDSIESKTLRQILSNTAGEYGDFIHLAEETAQTALMLSGGLPTAPIEQIQSFSECLLRAKLAARRGDSILSGGGGDHVRPADDKRMELAREHYHDMVQAASRAVQLQSPATATRNLGQAYTLLYKGQSQLGRKAEALESAREWFELGGTSDSALSAGLFVLRVRFQETINEPENEAPSQGFMSLATAILDRRSSGRQADEPRLLLGNYWNARKEPLKAAQAWAAVSPSHQDYAKCCYYAGLSYWSLHIGDARDNKSNPTVITPESNKAVTLLQQCVSAPRSAEAVEADSIQTIARIWLSEIQITQNEADAGWGTLQPVLRAMKEKTLNKDFSSKMRSKALGLALRAAIERKDLEIATEILELAAHGSNAGVPDESWAPQLRKLTAHVEDRINAEKSWGPEAGVRVRVIRDSYLTLLNRLAHDGRELPTTIRLWLGESYAAMSDINSANQILKHLPKPSRDSSPEKVKTYLAGQLRIVRAFRRAEQFGEATRLLESVLTDPNARRRPEFVRERIALLQDQEKYGEAIAQWGRYIRSLRPHSRRSAHVRGLLDDAQLQLLICHYRQANQQSNEESREQGIRRAVQLAVDLQKRDFGGPVQAREFEQFLDDPRNKSFKRIYEESIFGP